MVLDTVTDAYSKWLEVKPLSSPTTGPTIRVLQSIFATHRLPKIMVSDNDSAFTSQEFGNFMKGKEVVHITTAPYHPSSNGLAERAAQTFKAAMKRMKNEQGTLETKLDEFLFRYRITPHATTGEVPAVILMGRRPRSCLDLLHPDLARKTREAQEQQRKDHDKSCSYRNLETGQTVLVRNFGRDRIG